MKNEVLDLVDKPHRIKVSRSYVLSALLFSELCIEFVGEILCRRKIGENDVSRNRKKFF